MIDTIVNQFYKCQEFVGELQYESKSNPVFAETMHSFSTNVSDSGMMSLQGRITVCSMDMPLVYGVALGVTLGVAVCAAKVWSCCFREKEKVG